MDIAMSFIIKTTPFTTAAGEIVSILERPFKKYNGEAIATGDETFVWFSETEKLNGQKGRGLIGRGLVHRVERRPGRLIITLSLTEEIQRPFGNAELSRFEHAPQRSPEAELYTRLRKQSNDGIREITDEAAVILRGQFQLASNNTEVEADQESVRLQRLGNVASRPGQKRFSEEIRRLYRGRCAITDCGTAEALEAAHIHTEQGCDYNASNNGILLRADIHALFDAGLIALSSHGTRIDVSPQLNDLSYEFLRAAQVFRPEANAPSSDNIDHHRRRFGFETP
jgi:hypothetical protein